jgi:putative hydrolase
MREHFLGLVKQTVDAVDPDPKRFLDALGRAAGDLRSGRNPLDEGGVMAVLASPEQRLVLDQVAGLMSLLEGHGDVTMDRAGADQIPSAHRFGTVLRQRRAQANPAVKLLQKLIGLEAKMKQYEQGERFIEVVEREGGTELLDRAWIRPENLPTIAEIRDPESWISRVGPTVAA